MGTTFSVAPVCWHTSCHGTMLEWCSIQVTRISSPGFRFVRAQLCATRLIESVQPRVKTTSRLCAALIRRCTFVARALVGLASRARSAGASRDGCSRCRAGSSGRARPGPAAASASCWRCRGRPAACRGRPHSGWGSPSRIFCTSNVVDSASVVIVEYDRQSRRHGDTEDARKLARRMHPSVNLRASSCAPCLRALTSSSSYFTASAGIAASSQRSRRSRSGWNFTRATMSPAKLRISSARASPRVMPRACR